MKCIENFTISDNLILLPFTWDFVLSEFSFLSFALLFFAIFCIQIIVVFRYIIRFEYCAFILLQSN